MRNFGIYLLVLLLTATGLFLSCSKSSKTESFTYTVNGVQDYTMSRASIIEIPLSLVLNEGIPEAVTLTLSGLPPGISASPSSLIGYPYFAGSFRLIDDTTIPGSYPIKITASSASTKTKTYDFNLDLTVPSDCGGNLDGVYTGTSSEYTGSYKTTITRSDDHGVLIHNFFGSNRNVPLIFATLSCTTNSIIILNQKLESDLGISGHGTFTQNSISLTYNILFFGGAASAGPFTATFNR